MGKAVFVSSRWTIQQCNNAMLTAQWLEGIMKSICMINVATRIYHIMTIGLHAMATKIGALLPGKLVLAAETEVVAAADR